MLGEINTYIINTTSIMLSPNRRLVYPTGSCVIFSRHAFGFWVSVLKVPGTGTWVLTLIILLIPHNNTMEKEMHFLICRWAHWVPLSFAHAVLPAQRYFFLQFLQLISSLFIFQILTLVNYLKRSRRQAYETVLKKVKFGARLFKYECEPRHLLTM